ncbi:PQQ-dependent sugar dehydrogenase [Qipengyuania qiaonensis]|uniref:PQQ-dependent sugar dehydrogenase n=1 Tax=Qipengyuania qiaonensis TaxID=2867240 RepID=A0ABS7J8S1_9SPHN|nr:PQQ-dependent sugar dehydrogenase [Qipengyuania qiaonensis]MBX7483692.1 PQQ-dependent sugar dehydrogenase [Qipengyuania qiaonensis]
MKKTSILAVTLSPLLLASSCGSTGSGDSQPTPIATSTTPPAAGEWNGTFAIAEHGSFAEPWASAFIPGTEMLFITEKAGTAKIFDTSSDRLITVSGLPQVDYGGQGGLGEVAFLPSESAQTVGRRTIYLTWAEAGSGDMRGAVVGRGQLVCQQAGTCSIEGMNVIWRQTPKVTGRGHYSHRIAFSPDESHMFVASGDRQKLTPAQDTTNTLGTIVRLNLDGTPASGNPLADNGSPSNQIWSWGHRNILGMDFDAQGRLWEVEHGPAGGDELNLVARGANYGWPERSNGNHYNGDDIPDHSPDDGFAQPAISWSPVIAPGNMIFYSGTLFNGLAGDLLIAGLQSEGLVRVAIDGDTASEAARYDMGERIRQIVEGPDGALWVLEDGDGGRLLELRPG